MLRAAINRLTLIRYVRVAPVFVSVSVFIWLISALSEQHTAKVAVYLSYKDTGPLQYLENAKPQKIHAQFTGNGFRLMWARMFPQTLSIAAHEIALEDETYLLTPKKFQTYVENHFDGSLAVYSKNMSAIQTPIRSATRRLLAVRMIDSVALKAGYDWTSNYIYTPDSVYVSGAGAAVSKLEYAYVSHGLSTAISENFDLMCGLVSDNNQLLKWSQEQIRVQRSVTRFTEHNLRVPIALIQPHQEQEIELMPRYAEVFFSVPLSQIKNIKPTDFKVVCDYTINTDSGFLPVTVLESPNQVRILRVSPTEAKFLVRK